MPDATDLIGRAESAATLIRFEDATDANTPRLKYSVPLPGHFQGKFYIDTDFFNDAVPWTAAARASKAKVQAITDLVAAIRQGRPVPLPPLEDLAVIAPGDPRRGDQTAPRFNIASASGDLAAVPNEGSRPADDRPSRTSAITIQYGDKQVSLDLIAARAEQGFHPVFHRTFGGTLKLGFTPEAPSEEDANPRFVIIEHYRLSSFFGDYGAGRTLGAFSLMPGEETTLYIRNWRRSEETVKESSSIFDSYTSEAADEFETDVMSETTDTEQYSTAHEWHSKYSGSGEINLGIAKTKHSGELNRSRTSSSAHEHVAKSAAKVATKHSSKASAKREIEVTQELESKTQVEVERITERKIRNTNLSRTLNIVTRELNQEFTTYLSLIDVSLAFVNSRGIFELFTIAQVDDMLDKYIEPPGGGFVDPSSPFGPLSARSYVRRHLLDQVNEVFDFRGTRHFILEEVAEGEDEEEVFPLHQAPAARRPYIRMKRGRTAARLNPFYDPGDVPVEGVVMNENTNTVRTPAVIIDGLLGHGVTLDNYALGLQQEALRREQVENRKTELALSLIEGGTAEQLEAYRQLFGSVDADFLRQVALGGSD
jgi:hypothetical protein